MTFIVTRVTKTQAGNCQGPFSWSHWGGGPWNARDVDGQREEAQNPDYSWALRADGPFQEVAGGEVGGLDARPEAWNCSHQGCDKKRASVGHALSAPPTLQSCGGDRVRSGM